MDSKWRDNRTTPPGAGTGKTIKAKIRVDNSASSYPSSFLKKIISAFQEFKTLMNVSV